MRFSPGYAVVLLGLGLASCCGPRYAPGTVFTPAEYAAHAARLREKAPPGFTAIVAAPFVVIGDGPPANVREDAAQIVRWATSRLRADYFALDPGDILDVWLFNGDDSYERNASVLFGSVPRTPYGYYSPCDRALIMNIALGYGTLVHEMVHAFIEANFPAAPVWLDEGLASLYEAPEDREGHIYGGLNWRLPLLQEALWDGRVPSFEEMTRASRSEFHGARQGVYYSEARYLLYYLQEQGKLLRFYRRFVERHAADPSGIGTLREVLGRDLGAFRKRWEGFVLELRYERKMR